QADSMETRRARRMYVEIFAGRVNNRCARRRQAHVSGTDQPGCNVVAIRSRMTGQGEGAIRSLGHFVGHTNSVNEERPVARPVASAGPSDLRIDPLSKVIDLIVPVARDIWAGPCRAFECRDV